MFGLGFCKQRCKGRDTDENDVDDEQALIQLASNISVGSPVIIHVYDLDPITSKLNAVTVPLLNAGAFHVGVEVYGKEYSFGQSGPNESGITVAPTVKGHPYHIYSRSVYRGFTRMTEKEFEKYLRRFARQMLSRPYNFLTNNCVTWADELCIGLGVQGLPPWIINFQQPASEDPLARAIHHSTPSKNPPSTKLQRRDPMPKHVAGPGQHLNSEAQRHFEDPNHRSTFMSNSTIPIRGKERETENTRVPSDIYRDSQNTFGYGRPSDPRESHGTFGVGPVDPRESNDGRSRNLYYSNNLRDHEPTIDPVLAEGDDIKSPPMTPNFSSSLNFSVVPKHRSLTGSGELDQIRLDDEMMRTLASIHSNNRYGTPSTATSGSPNKHTPRGVNPRQQTLVQSYPSSTTPDSKGERKKSLIQYVNNGVKSSN